MTTPQQWMAAADAAYDAGRFAAAAGLYARVLALAPDHPAPLFNLAAALRDDGDIPRAARWFERIARLRPDLAQAQQAAGDCALRLGDAASAAVLLARAAAADPYNADIARGRGDAAKHLGDQWGAAALYRRALTLDPARAAGWFNLGVTETDCGRPDRAVVALSRALGLEPGHGAAGFNLACELLMCGRLAEGFAALDHRFDSVMPRPPHPLPWWRGEPLAGRRLLLLAEQGHGDGIQFIRFAPLAARAGAAKIGVEAPPGLLRLLAAVDGVAAVHPLGQAPMADYDLFCPLMSLPQYLGVTLDNLPAAAPYVAAAPDNGRFDRYFPVDDRRLRVGLAWSGEERPHDPRQFAHNRRRSLPLTALAPLLALPDVRFYNLQFDPARRAELAAGVIDPMGEVADFADTAAIINRLDVVISVCTAIAHLAGALGKPVLLALAAPADWRWMVGRDDSPWYPGMKLFRQPAPGDWGPVVAALCAHLHAFDCRTRR